MKNSQILLSAYPQGKFLEGIISGTPKPGTKMQLQLGTAPVGGRFTYEAYNPGATGDPRGTIMLLEDELQGKGYADAYVSGTRGRLYVPIVGEEMNVLVAGAAGTGSANAFTIGERLESVKGTGKFQAQATSANPAEFVSMEHIDEVPDVDTLVFATFQGAQ